MERTQHGLASKSKELLPFLTKRMTVRLLCYGLLLFGAGACHHPPVPRLLPAGSGAVTLALDSVQQPELGTFPLRLRLTNNTRHRVVLVFDTIANKYFQVKNLYLVAGQDTFFLGLKTRRKYSVFAANTATSFCGIGYFGLGKTPIDSYGQVDTVFQTGTLVYTFPLSGPRQVSVAGPSPSRDTLLFPTKMAARTSHASVVERFLNGSYPRQEKQLPPH
jgi:hypothetical protein